MASLNFPTISPTTNISTIAPHHRIFPKTSQLYLSRAVDRHTTSKISCNVATNDDDYQNLKYEKTTGKLDRRNMLIGLGGMYGATATLSGGPSVLAAPIQTPIPSTCEQADVPSNAGDLNCCPPIATNIVDFVLPPAPSTLRVRLPAHLVDDEYLQKFARAISLMKALPDDDPRSFTQQANVHCAYCNGSYSQVGFPNLDLQVHGSWLFFPFHRWYLYFFERILGSLIEDPTFAIPFWNWDAAGGMQMPAMYTDPNSPLYNKVRDQAHLSPKILDLNYDLDDSNDVSDQRMISNNLTLMYRQMVTNARTPRLFLGQPYRAGARFSPGGGSIENSPHGTVHVWTGDPNQPNFEDMGNFYSAGRDPLFYAHHANVDRMWFLWKTLSTNNRDFTDPDWLNASFIFYDENSQAVRVRVQDCLDTARLGFTYQNADLPWLNARPDPRSRSKVRSVTSTPQTATAMESQSTINFPKPLKKTIRTNVARPKKSRTKKEKKQKEEILVIDVDVKEHDKYVKFDVYINDEDDVPSKKVQVKAEYAGSFVNVPHKHKHGEDGSHKTSFRVGLTDLIDDLGADDDDGVMVSLVPRAGKDNVIIKSVKIEFAS
ncbi:polyphenol oxidase I, chloroplastic-like [Amaranthus tricolor]|uniref:polyphenol oxidase I, chloroplastic-like n=1 Tax=Amaranthus tricolor TaxID=29722 RepID=UPI0025835EDB|nr:polyphenol oxidase I, chloroplastic-like [Amaranthus tricolor]